MSTFEPSDAWLLTAVVVAGGRATLSNWVGVADYVSHAIFTLDELNGTRSRLGAVALVRQRGTSYYAGNPAMALLPAKDKRYGIQTLELTRFCGARAAVAQGAHDAEVTTTVRC